MTMNMTTGGDYFYDQPKEGAPCRAEQYHQQYWRVLERGYYRDSLNTHRPSHLSTVVCLSCVSVWRMAEVRCQEVGVADFAVAVTAEAETETGTEAGAGLDSVGPRSP